MSKNDSLAKTVGVALGVCIVCSIFVSTAAVALKSRQDKNKALEKRKNILLAGGLLDPKGSADIEAVFKEKIQPVFVDLETAKQLTVDNLPEGLDPKTYDIKKAAKDPALSAVIPGDKDLAGIKRKPNLIQLYMVKEGGTIARVIFPIYGKGLWSTMYGFFCLDRDLKTVKGLTFYEHGETPGLGGEVDNVSWKASWKEKTAYDDGGKWILEVIKGKAASGSKTQIDGLSGATITTRGVDNTIKYWFGADGYGPYIEKLRKEGLHE